MGCGSRYLGPFANMLRSFSLATMFRSPVITWPAGLYLYGEVEREQSGGLDLKSAIVRSRKTRLWLKILVAIGLV